MGARSNKWRVAILGASGYAGAELLRLLAQHPDITVAALTADVPGFTYRDSRDLIGFIDGTANPTGDDARAAALIPAAAPSFISSRSPRPPDLNATPFRYWTCAGRPACWSSSTGIVMGAAFEAQ